MHLDSGCNPVPGRSDDLSDPCRYSGKPDIWSFHPSGHGIAGQNPGMTGSLRLKIEKAVGYLSVLVPTGYL